MLVSKETRKTLTDAASGYHEALMQHTPAKQYLANRFGAEYAQALAVGFRLGYVETPIAGHERFRGQLVIPYLTTGDVIGMKTRCITDHHGQKCNDFGHPKYNGPAGLGSHMFNARAILDDTGDLLVICEGEIDTMVMDGIVGIPSVGIAGAQAWKTNAGIYNRIVSGFGTVLVVGDGDDAGKQFADELTEYLTTQGIGARAILMPTGEDVDSYTRKAGIPEIRKRLGLKPSL